MILTVARTALLLLLEVKGKSVLLLGVQIPFYGPDGLCTVVQPAPARKRWLFCNEINCYLLETDDIKKTLTGRWELVKGLSFIKLVFMLIVLEPCDSSTCSCKMYHVCSRGGGGGYSGFQVTGMIEWGQKSKPPKNP